MIAPGTCECGCGEPLTTGLRFVRGHVFRSQEMKDRVAETNKLRRGTWDRNALIATLAADRRYTLTEIGRMFNLSRQRVDQLFKPIQRRAREAARRAESLGTLQRPAKCQVCHRDSETQMHHPNYGEPLRVEWLCPRCHARADGRVGPRTKTGALVTWKCMGCGKAREVNPCDAKRRFCSRRCRTAYLKSRPPLRVRHPDGHNWVVLLEPRRQMREERFVAETVLGRRLARHEWVILADGNPDNVDPSNILVLTPKQAMAVRDGRVRATDLSEFCVMTYRPKAA